MVLPVSSAVHDTSEPDSSEAFASAASSGSTPTTRAEGASAFTAVATPDERPPPETGTRTLRHARQVLDDLEAARSLARDDGGIVVGLDHDEAPLAHERQRQLVPLLRVVAGEDDLGAIAADALDLHARRALRHADDGRGTQQPSGAGDGLRVVARRVGDDAAGSLGIGQGGDLVVRAAHLEGTDRLE